MRVNEGIYFSGIQRENGWKIGKHKVALVFGKHNLAIVPFYGPNHILSLHAHKYHIENKHMADKLDNFPISRTAPGEGERRGHRGYSRQYDLSAAAIYSALKRNELEWIGLADRKAGIADDLVLGFPEKVIGHQFKMSQFSGKISLKALLIGADGLLKPLAISWRT